jgi:hypothetical protein
MPDILRSILTKAGQMTISLVQPDIHNQNQTREEGIGRMKNGIICLLFFLLIVVIPSAHAASKNPSPDRKDAADWTIMPVGARPAYMGIHGGTMPVSLLVSGDGSSLVTFVGRTGNDFLEELRKTPMPSALNATVQRSMPVDGIPQESGDATLTAGGGTGSLPVICLSGRGGRMSSLAEHLQPFGFSDKPLSIEGNVSKPAGLSPTKQFPQFFQPHYLQPRRNTN